MKTFHLNSFSRAKNHHLFVLLMVYTFIGFLLFSCNSSESQVVTGSETEKTKASEPAEPSSEGLSQQGDYSQLFNPDLKIVNF